MTPTTSSVSISSLSTPSPVVTHSPFLALPKDATTVRRVILSCLQDNAIFHNNDGPNVGQLCALGKSITHRLTSNFDNAKMVHIQELIVRVCEYADIVLHACFGAGRASDAKIPTTNPNAFVLEEVTTPPSESATTDKSSFPAKSDEIRRADKLETVINITPYDQPFQDLQNELRALAEQSTELRARLNALSVQNEENRTKLYKLEERANHRLSRARARQIRFNAVLEEKWLMDPDSIATNKAPCSACVKNRRAKPLLSHPAPAPASTAKTTTSK